MPEGDVLFRTAATMQRWLAGREVTAATTRVPGLAASRIVGRSIESVEAWGKHLLVRFDSGQVLHTHLRMSGSWHVYRTGEPWQRPERQARIVLTCGDRLAVCYNAPVVELLAPRAEQVHPSLSRLGPDILDDPVDVDEVRRRAKARPAELALGELLLDRPSWPVSATSGAANHCSWRVGTRGRRSLSFRTRSSTASLPLPAG